MLGWTSSTKSPFFISWGEKKSWMHICRSLRMVAVPLIMPEIGRCRRPFADWRAFTHLNFVGKQVANSGVFGWSSSCSYWIYYQHLPVAGALWTLRDGKKRHSLSSIQHHLEDPGMFFFLVVVVGHSSFQLAKRNLSVSFNSPVHLQATKHQFDPSAILSYPHNNVCFMSPVLGHSTFVPTCTPLLKGYTVYGIRHTGYTAYRYTLSAKSNPETNVSSCLFVKQPIFVLPLCGDFQA